MSSNASASKSYDQGLATALSPAILKMVWNTLEVIGITLGPALLAFNLFNFNLGRLGIYYRDAAQYGIAIGVLLIAIALLIRKQKL